MADMDGDGAEQADAFTLGRIRRHLAALADDAAELDAYLWTRLLPKGTTLDVDQANANHDARTGFRPKTLPLTRDTVLAFLDLQPGRNWEHDCEYLLFPTGDKGIAPYRTERARLPPFFYEREDPQDYERVCRKRGEAHPPPRGEVERPAKPPPRRVPEFPSEHCFALLFSGNSNWRHVNDLEFLYRTLVDEFQVPSGHVYVLNFDGTRSYRPSADGGDPSPGGTWPGDKTAYRMEVRGAGTLTDLEAVLCDLGPQLTDRSQVLIHTSNHGSRSDGTCALHQHSPSGWIHPIQDFEFAELISRHVPCADNLHVMMEQCHAGGFMEPVLTGSRACLTTAAMACASRRTSEGGGGDCFDPFARDWISAWNGRTPYGRPLLVVKGAPGPAVGVAQDAFFYASAVRSPRDSPLYGAARAPADAYRATTTQT